ncbi:MAG: energy-coupling factor ABC transporter permease [bacterium]
MLNIVLISLLIVLTPVSAYAMHISDGVLSLRMSAVWLLLCIPFVLKGIREIEERRQLDLDYFPLLAMTGVAVFILSVFHIPVPVAGSCSHPTGGALAAIVVGPFAAVVINMIALLFQAVFLAHGGLVVWGANTFSMGIVGVLSGYGTYLGLKTLRIKPWTAAAVAGLVADLMTYVTAGFQLAVDLHGSRGILFSWKIYLLGYLPTQLPVAVLDALLTGFMVKYIIMRRPDLARKFSISGMTAGEAVSG